LRCVQCHPTCVPGAHLNPTAAASLASLEACWLFTEAHSKAAIGHDDVCSSTSQQRSCGLNLEQLEGICGTCAPACRSARGVVGTYTNSTLFTWAPCADAFTSQNRRSQPATCRKQKAGAEKCASSAGRTAQDDQRAQTQSLLAVSTPPLTTAMDQGPEYNLHNGNVQVEICCWTLAPQLQAGIANAAANACGRLNDNR
jgi:hypothetical protein